jgi:hypothetical protein
VRIWFVALAGFTLGACSREADSFSPQIVITKPANESVTPRSNLTIEGYAMDDKGVMKLVLNGTTDLLAKGELAAQRGRKIVKFSFPATSLAGGKVSYELRAVDTSKRSSTREIKVTVDTQQPTLTIDNVDSQLTTVAVSGVARDNQRVARIAVNGEPLNASSAREVPFYTVIPRSRKRTIDFIVKDGVGNVLTRSIPVPIPPPPPPPVVEEASATQPTPRRRRTRSRRTPTTQTTTVTTPTPATTPVTAPRDIGTPQGR